MKKNNYIHINSGKYKGKKILLPDVETTRPSKSIVRNSIFDTLQNEVYNKTFIELFGGSGSVGFEAISRGASQLYLFEMNRVALKTLQQNRKSFSDENIEIIGGDSFQNIYTILDKLQNNSSILYIDPPFSIRDGMENIYNKLYDLIDELVESNKFKYIIIEHLSTEKPKESFRSFSLNKSRKFGKTTLSYYFLSK